MAEQRITRDNVEMAVRLLVTEHEVVLRQEVANHRAETIYLANVALDPNGAQGLRRIFTFADVRLEPPTTVVLSDVVQPLPLGMTTWRPMTRTTTTLAPGHAAVWHTTLSLPLSSTPRVAPHLATTLRYELGWVGNGATPNHRTTVDGEDLPVFLHGEFRAQQHVIAVDFGDVGVPVGAP
jgi:hypothetical protein